MRCHEFEALWQEHLDNGIDPQLDADLTAHALTCESCSALLEGTDHVLSFSEYPSFPVVAKDRFTTPSLFSSSCDNNSCDYNRHISPPNHAVAGSSRSLAIAAGLMALIAFTLWGRVWMSVFEPANRVALAKNAVEESLSGPLSAKIASADGRGKYNTDSGRWKALADQAKGTSDLAVGYRADYQASPLVPSPLQLVLRTRETRYLLSANDLDNLSVWNQRWLDFPNSSPELIALGVEPLKASWEVAMELIRITLPGNWTLTQNEGYNLLTSPLQAAFSDGN